MDKIEIVARLDEGLNKIEKLQDKLASLKLDLAEAIESFEELADELEQEVPAEPARTGQVWL